MKTLRLGPLVLLVPLVFTWTIARENGRQLSASPRKPLGAPTWTMFNVNLISTNFNVAGLSDMSPIQGGFLGGMIYPKGTGKGAVYASGLMWGTKVDTGQNIRIGGCMWGTGLQPGRILDGMQPEPSDLPKNRIYRVRPDIPPWNNSADISSEVNDGEGSPGEIYSQYQLDWNEWPGQDGAPFDDKNHNGIYEPAIDIPGFPGADQTIWAVARDIPSSQLFLTLPIGVELQTTVWGYRSEGALGSTLLRRYVLINRNSVPFDSMYVCMWSDADVGNAGDDVAGCDTTRSLGFVYNGQENDNVYFPLPPPVVGFDFFQGPLVEGAPTDSAIFKGKRVYGKRNLPMTGFFANTYSTPNPVLVDPAGTWDYPHVVKMYDALKGLVGETGESYQDPATNAPTSFPFAGDPEKRTGWLDGTKDFPIGDRRIGVCSGPFTMMPGDTQEVVVAEICAGAIPGCDRLSAIGLLKYYDDQAQAAYNNFFAVPRAPSPPKVTVSSLDQEVVLIWGDDSAAVAATEVPAPSGYAFEGYNIYQLPSSSAAVTEGRRLATFDVINGVGKIIDDEFNPVQGAVLETVKQNGTDSGIQRWVQITKDRLQSDWSLVNGNPYYFAVTAYNYNAGGVPATLESPLTILTVYPHSPNPGVTYAASYGDTLKGVTHTLAQPGGNLSDGRVIAQVISPTLLKLATYNVVFGELKGQTVWHLVRTEGTKVDTVAKNIADQTGSDAGSPLIDGILFRVFTATNDFKSFLTVANANGKIAPPQPGSFAFNNSGFPIGPPLDPSQDRPDGTKQQSAGLTVSSGWGIHTGMNAADMDYTYPYFKNRVTQSGARWPRIIPYDFEIRFTAKGSDALFPSDFTGNVDQLVHIPFELWNIGINTPENLADDYQMFANIFDVDSSYTFNLMTQAATDSHDFGGGGATHSISGNANDPFTDWIYWVEPADKTPGHSGYDAIVAQVQSDIAANQDPYLGAATDGDILRRMVLVGWNFGTVASGVYKQQMPEVGTIFRILSNKPNSSNDMFTISVPGNSYSNELAKNDISAINIFPNPYYGVNPQEINKYNRFVTINHLPKRATIRIFNLAGVMVRKIDRESDSQFERWDLKNDSGLPVGSGLYIFYIEMPDLGSTKILKLALVQEQQILDRY
jgi:hypothetical protein